MNEIYREVKTGLSKQAENKLVCLCVLSQSVCLLALKTDRI